MLIESSERKEAGVRISATMTAAWLGLALVCTQARAQTPIPPSPADFVLAASQSDQYEMTAAMLAAVQGQDERVRAFARRMIQEHTRLADEMRKAALAAGIPEPGHGLSSDQAMLLSGLQALRGAAFDKAYMRQQVLAHTQAFAVEESFAGGGADPKLRDAAHSALPTIEDHLKAARQLETEIAGG